MDHVGEKARTQARRDFSVPCTQWPHEIPRSPLPIASDSEAHIRAAGRRPPSDKHQVRRSVSPLEESRISRQIICFAKHKISGWQTWLRRHTCDRDYATQRFKPRCVFSITIEGSADIRTTCTAKKCVIAKQGCPKYVVLYTFVPTFVFRTLKTRGGGGIFDYHPSLKAIQISLQNILGGAVGNRGRIFSSVYPPALLSGASA